MVLDVTEAETDLGVIITNNCKNKLQAEKALNRANYELERLRKTFKFFNAEILKILYPTFVRPHLEYASAVWNSISMLHETKLEEIQRRETKRQNNSKRPATPKGKKPHRLSEERAEETEQ